MKNLTKNISFIVVIIFFWCKGNSQINTNGFNIFYYENDSVSSKGYLKNGKPEGYWKNYERTGALKSEGNRKNHLLDSTWIFYKNSYRKEEINYLKGKRNGAYKEYADSGKLYSLSFFLNDTLQGEKFIYYPTGELHFSYFYLNGNYHGTAYEFDKDSVIISIFEYNKGKLVVREKINRYNSQGEKIGLWKKFNSQMTLIEEGTYKNGKKDGIFKEYKINGELKGLKKFELGLVQLDAEELKFVELRREFYSTGELHFTIAEDDNKKRQGVTQEYSKKGEIIGTEIYKNDTLYAKGLIDYEGLKQGKWKYYYQGDKVIAQGKFKKDLKTGTWNYFYRSGEKEQKGKYSRGRLTGKWMWFYENGATHRSENYRKNKEDGEFIEYDINGEILTKGNYINGLKEGDWFYKVGDHTEIGKFTDGEKEGEWVYYYDNKKVNFKGSYKNGKPIGKHLYYHYNGVKKWVGSYGLGKKEGKWIRYNEDGEVLVTLSFKKGILVKADGKKIKPALKEELEL